MLARIALLITVLLGGICNTTPLALAQARQSLGTIDGSVTDTSLVPLADANAWILGSQIEVATGPNGRFRITGLTAGRYLLFVRRIGYTPTSSAVELSGGDTVRVWLALQRATPTLDSVRVVAASMPTRLAEFEARRKAGDGQFMNQADIEKLNLVAAPDLLQHFMSVSVGTGVAINRRTLPTKVCPFQFFIDGVAVPTPRLDTDLPSPKELAGIEVYANSAAVPLQYKTFGGGARNRYGGGFCGVILLWTRSG